MFFYILIKEKNSIQNESSSLFVDNFTSSDSKS